MLLVGKTRESSEKQLFKIIYMISPNVTLRYRANWILTFLIQVPILLLLFFFNEKIIYLCVFGCTGSLLLRKGFLQLWRAGATL